LWHVLTFLALWEQADEMAVRIVERLASARGGLLPVGDKSSPEEIQNEFPGASKASFKRAVATLYKERKVQPSPYSIQLVDLSNDEPVLSSDEAKVQ
jgi:predicted RNA-binding protein (virulence factor B family)